MAVIPDDLAGELHELIAALDRRVPWVVEAGEAAIARDAAALRELDKQNRVAAPQVSDRSKQVRATSG